MTIFGHVRIHTDFEPARSEVDVTRLETKITFVESVIRRSTMQHATFPGNGADYLGGTLVKIERTDIGLPSASPMTDGGICSENRASLNLDDRVAGAKAVPIAYDPSSPTSDAECYIQQELESSPELQGTRRSVLRSALDLITQLSQNPMSAENPQSLFACKGASLQNIHYPSIELLSWMLRGKLPFSLHKARTADGFQNLTLRRSASMFHIFSNISHPKH